MPRRTDILGISLSLITVISSGFLALCGLGGVVGAMLWLSLVGWRWEPIPYAIIAVGLLLVAMAFFLGRAGIRSSMHEPTRHSDAT
jgi:hypothetical protein